MSHQTQVELDQEFRVDAQGRIAFTNDPSRVLRNRVRMVIGTSLGERVMRPQYGTPLVELLFDADDEMTSSIILSDIQRALEVYEPGVVVHGVSADNTDTLDGIINVNVSYSAANSPYESVTVPVNAALLMRGGSITEERSGG